MNPEQELQFLGCVREFSKSGTWAQMREMLVNFQASHIRAAASVPDPMAGRAAARADELGRVMEFVDKAGEREAAIADAMKTQSAEEAEKQVLDNGGGEYTTPVATV